METPSIALIRELFPFAKPTKNITQTAKEDLLRTLYIPSSAAGERWEILLTRHKIMLKLVAENQSGAEFVSAGFRDRGITCLKQPKGTRTWTMIQI